MWDVLERKVIQDIEEPVEGLCCVKEPPRYNTLSLLKLKKSVDAIILA
jgi:hypothetical protein